MSHEEESLAPSESEVLTILKRMQQQMVFLEKKLDQLLQNSAQPAERPYQERRFPKPFRHSFGHGPSGHGHGHGQGRPHREHGGRDRHFSESSHGFPRRKPFSHRRKEH